MNSVVRVMAALALMALPGLAAIPENDQFAARLSLFGTNITTTGNNVGATKEPGEPDPSFSASKSVWWTWTAPVSGSLTLNTTGTSFDTMISVFTGNVLSNLSLVGFNDNDTNTPVVRLNVVAGTAYQIAVDGPGGTAGNITLKLMLGPTQTPPSNDNFANRVTLSGTHISNITGSNAGATAEPGEPVHADALGGKSVWWTWTAPASGGLTLTTQNSDIDTVLAVYTGNALSNLVFVAGNDEDPLSSFGFESRVTCNVVSNTTYQIVIDGFEGDWGDVRLRLDLDAAFPAPTNDFFANRATLVGNNITVTNSNVGASFEAADGNFELGEPLHDYTFGGRSVWWTWTAPSSGVVTLTTSNSTFDTILAVYTGTALTNLQFVAANDEDYLTLAEGDSRVTFSATSGTTYQIAVDGYDSESGTINLRLNLAGSQAPPGNNNFANRILLSGNSVTTSGSNLGATFEPGEPLHDDVYGGKSVWWRWVSPGPGTVTIDTIGSLCDTLLAVYTGSDLPNLTEIASDDESGGNYTSKVTFYTKSGVTYQIAADGYDGDSGDITLHVVFTQASYSLTLVTNPVFGGEIVFDPAPDQNGKYEPGAVVTAIATPANQYVFTNWSGGLFSTNNPGTFAMTSNKTLSANFYLPPPRIVNFLPQSLNSIVANGFRFSVVGPSNYIYVTERSTNLANWVPFQTNEITSSAGLAVQDFSATNNPRRFYRARRLQ